MSDGAAIVAIVGVGVVLLAAWVWRWWRRPDRRRRAPWFNRPPLPHESGERMLNRTSSRASILVWRFGSAGPTALAFPVFP